MKKLLLLLPVLFLMSFAPKDKCHTVKIKTNKGKIKVLLYNETPLHRDNMLKLVHHHFYDSLLFHRVIKNFMIQGGDPDSKNASAGKLLGDGDVGYTIPAEFRPDLFHKKGALAAARDDNPNKSSSGCQFYIVQGKIFTDDELTQMETKTGRKIPEAQRVVYKTIGGAPHLDQNYTVYGEVVKGLNVVDIIASVQTDKNDRPLSDVRIIKMREGWKMKLKR